MTKYEIGTPSAADEPQLVTMDVYPNMPSTGENISVMLKTPVPLGWTVCYPSLPAWTKHRGMVRRWKKHRKFGPHGGRLMKAMTREMLLCRAEQTPLWPLLLNDLPKLEAEL